MSNLFGTTPLAVSGMRVARSTGGSSIDTGVDLPVTFAGQSAIAIAAGAEVYSDAVPLATSALAMIAVSVCFGDSHTDDAGYAAMERRWAALASG